LRNDSNTFWVDIGGVTGERLLYRNGKVVKHFAPLFQKEVVSGEHAAGNVSTKWRIAEFGDPDGSGEMCIFVQSLSNGSVDGYRIGDRENCVEGLLKLHQPAVDPRVVFGK